MRFPKAAALLLFVIAASCHTSEPQSKPSGHEVAYYQSRCFQADEASARQAVKRVLALRKFEVEAEEGPTLTAFNPEMTSVEILTYTGERLSTFQAVFSGEVRLRIRFLKQDQKTCVTVEPVIQALLGRSSPFKNSDWRGHRHVFSSRGKLENEFLTDLARELKDKNALAVLVTQGIELEGGFTLQ